MSDLAGFKVHCLELFKKSHNLYGSEALCLFQEFRIPDYIDSRYDELLTFEEKSIVEDINEFIIQCNSAGIPIAS